MFPKPHEVVPDISTACEEKGGKIFLNQQKQNLKQGFAKDAFFNMAALIPRGLTLALVGEEEYCHFYV